ncbi:MAG: ribbon-helix-helix protein, CopG family [Acidimicrobiales bacterium]
MNVSVRIDEDLAERLRARARAAGETLSERLRRYAEEGSRRDEHPLVTFRDGPTGRRAGLLGGPDIWEVAMWLDDLSGEPEPVAVLVEGSGLTRSQVDAAMRYRATYPDEVAARIELHRRETAAAPTSWRSYSTRCTRRSWPRLFAPKASSRRRRSA